MRVKRGLLLRAAIGALCLGAVATAHAQTSGLAFGLSAGMGHSDNITRVPEGEIDESFATAGFQLNARNQGRLSYSALGDLSYVDYLDDTFDSEVIGGFDGTLTYAFIPDRFTWTVEDTFGQQQINLFRPVTPDNRENVNFLSTGPDFSLPLGARNFLDIGGRYSDARYEDSDLDNERLGGTLALRRQLSSSNLLALSGQADRIEYNDAAGTEYDVRSAFVRYALNTARTALSADVGYTELEQDGDKSDGELLRLDFSRELSEATKVTLSAGQRYSDASEVFRILQRRSALDPQASPETTSDAFKYRYATLGWRFQKNRTSFGLSAGLNQERYVEQTDRDREFVDYRVELGRRLSRTLRASISARWHKNEFENVDFNSDDLRMRGTISWRLGARTYLALEVDHFNRSSNDPTSEYNETRGLLTVSYFPRGEQF